MVGARLSRLLLIASAFGAWGCDEEATPEGPGDVTEVCELTCGKLFTCGTLVSVSERDACVAACDSPICEVTQQEVDACASALTASSCAPVEGGVLPSECQLCPQTDAGTGDAGMSMPAASCTDLQPCCDALPEPERTACQTVVTANDSVQCIAARTLYCPAPDAGAADTGAVDAGAEDQGPADTGPPDTGVVDTGTPDTGPPDLGLPGPDAGGGGAICAELAVCCMALDLVQRITCEATVLLGVEEGCGVLLFSYRAQNLCP
ncbi:MAG: hypothetical protein AAFZ18_27885 [Myxococcota bacterium]